MYEKSACNCNDFKLQCKYVNVAMPHAHRWTKCVESCHGVEEEGVVALRMRMRIIMYAMSTQSPNLSVTDGQARMRTAWHWWRCKAHIVAATIIALLLFVYNKCEMAMRVMVHKFLLV